MRVPRFGVCAIVLGMQACGDSGADAAARPRSESLSVSFQDGQWPTTSYGGARDTMLDGHAPKTTHGADTSLSVEDSSDLVALLAWDLSGQLPGTAVVESVRITLEVSDRSPETFALYAAKRPWSQGKATWNEFAAGNKWEAGGAHGPGDRGDVVLGSFSAADTGPVTFTLNAAGVAVVQSWVADPAANLGFVLDGADTDNRLEFRASEYSTKAKRPKLTITWHEPDVGETTGTTGDGSTGEGGVDPGEVVLDPSPGTYRQTCDGSFGVALGPDHFLDGNDEDQGLRIYLRGADAGPVSQVDISASLGVMSSDEVDLEDAARIGDRIFMVSSHGRNKNGDLERMRYRFFAVDLAGAAPAVSLTTVGYTSTLLDELLRAGNWQTPHAGVIAALDAAASLSKATDANLAPKVDGINIEGLTWLPTVQRPRQLLLGFRNPMLGVDAIVVSLLNADAVVTGGKPQFGEATLLNLGGLRVRGMTWSPVHAAVLILAGPKDGAPGPFRLYRWSGLAADAPVLVTTITSFPGASGPEAILAFPDSHDVQILFDEGEHLINGKICKENAVASRSFSDTIVHVP